MEDSFDLSFLEDELFLNALNDEIISGNNYSGFLAVLDINNSSLLLNDTFFTLNESDLAFQSVIDMLHVYVLPIIILIGIIGNTVTFLVYVGTPRLCRQSSSVYLAFLAAVDNVSLVSVFVVWFGWVGIHIFHKNGWCQTILYSMYVCSFLSVWTVVSFTCERWIVVYHPLQRHSLCTRKRAIIVMTSLTVSALAFYTFSMFTTEVQYIPGGLQICSQAPEYKRVLQVIRSVDTMCTVILPSIAIIIMNTGIGIRICRYANSHSGVSNVPQDSVDEMFSHFSSHIQTDGNRQLHAQTSTSISRSNVRMTAMGSNTKVRHGRFFTRRHQTQLRITRALLIVSSVFILLNLPSYAFRIHAFVISVRHQSYELTFHAFIWQEFIQFFHYMNQSSNFFLYCACSRNFRLALKRLCRRMRRKISKFNNTMRGMCGFPSV